MSSVSPLRRSLLILAGASACSVRAQHSPASGAPLNFIVPQPAGNPTDGMARKLQPVLQQELGQAVLVENLPGAGGSIGVNKVLRTNPPDRTVLMSTQTEVILTPLSMAGVRYRAEDFRPIGLVTRAAYVLAGRPDLPAKNLAELISLARQSANRPLSHGHIGAGSMIHLLGEQWGRRARASLTHVPYKGVPPVVQDLMSGQIDLSFLPLAGNALPLIAAGKVRVFGTTGAVASPHLPQVMPLSQDPAFPGFVYGAWAALLVRRTTPDREVQRLHRAASTGLRDPALRAYIEGGGSEVVEPMSLAELDSFYTGEIRLYRGLARDIGVKPE